MAGYADCSAILLSIRSSSRSSRSCSTSVDAALEVRGHGGDLRWVCVAITWHSKPPPRMSCTSVMQRENRLIQSSGNKLSKWVCMGGDA